MDHPIRLDRVELAVRPWRTAATVAAAIAALELVLLVVVGGALLAKPAAPSKRTTAKAQAAKAVVRQLPPVRKATVAAELPRRKVKVVVLNGNGRQGAAAELATRVSSRGYRIGLVANAPSQDYVTSLVMYRRGFEGEARRLARDLGVRMVSPLDGMRPGQLHGAHAVLILGA